MYPIDFLVHFLVKMHTLDEIVMDFTPSTNDTFITLCSTKFVHKAISVLIDARKLRDDPLMHWIVNTTACTKNTWL